MVLKADAIRTFPKSNRQIVEVTLIPLTTHIRNINTPYHTYT